MSYRSQKLLKAARDQACAICGSVGTTVAAHSNLVEHGKGIGIKAPDCLIAWLCQATVVQLFMQGIVVVK
jgi:hypothetical protein